ncbi:MAG: aspartate:alanine exchanger family transporter [Rikenellaceae bacterium]
MLLDLLNYSYFSLFLIVALGFILGRIKIGGLSLDVSAVIFIALLFGHFGVIIPKELGNFGLVLFIFTIGIQAGPGFFSSFQSKGKTLIMITMLIILSAAATAVGAKYLFGVDTPSVVGLMAGALTSTPGLAVAIDSTNSPMASIAYGIAYPFGVIGVILFVKLLPKVMRVDLEAEAAKLERERRGSYPDLKTCIFRVSNPAAFGKTLEQMKVRTTTGAIVSRIRHGNDIFLPKSYTALAENDYVQAVGSNDALERFAIMIGEREEGELPLHSSQVVVSLLLSKQSMVNKRLGDLHLQRNFGCTVTRIRRSGITISPSDDLELKFGDKLMCVGERDAMDSMARLFGNDVKRLSDTDFFPIAMGIVIGVLVGKINISFPGGLDFSPGLTGGVLIAALILSAKGKTGPILWSMSGPANQLLRQLGLLLFLAEVGTSAGRNLVATFQESGLLLFGVGAAITLIPMIIAVAVGYGVLKISLLDLLGTLTGGMTSTPGLAAADSMVDSNIPSVAYATVYPIAMVILILSIQLISSYCV